MNITKFSSKNFASQPFHNSSFSNSWDILRHEFDLPEYVFFSMDTADTSYSE